MDEWLRSNDQTDTFWLQQSQEYGVINRSPSNSMRTVAKTAHHGSAFSSGPLRLSDGTLSTPQAGMTSPSLDVHHASPLAPLRPRDSQALDSLFDSDRIQEITLDIHQYLARIYPEPCWEDEPYEFLRGYI